MDASLSRFSSAYSSSESGYGASNTYEMKILTENVAPAGQITLVGAVESAVPVKVADLVLSDEDLLNLVTTITSGFEVRGAGANREIWTTGATDYETDPNLSFVVSMVDVAGATGSVTGSALLLDNPSEDTDGDGVVDSREIAEGTNPNDASSYNNLSKGLVAYYPFDGNTRDFSGNSNDGLGTNLVPISSELAVNGSAYRFNGTSSCISVPHSVSLNLESFTFSIWIKPARVMGDHQLILSKHTADVNWDGSWIFAVQSGTLTFQATPFFGGAEDMNAQGIVPTNVWAHYVLTYDASTKLWRYFLNAASEANGTNTTARQMNGNTVPLLIGAEWLGDGNKRYFFDGDMDAVRIYNRALTSAEVGQIYQQEAGSLDSDGDGLTDAWERGYGRYQVIPGSFTWEQAKTDAEARGGHLATITSGPEQAFVDELISPEVAPWIGLRRSGAVWSWLTGESYGYTNWAAGQPEGGAGLGDVAGITGGSFVREWSDTFAAWNDQNAYLLEFGYPTDPTKADTDGDGFNDSIESHYASDPNNPAVTPNTIRPA
ncbi:MAG: LamG-like jellyroll fold domain-containing protein, partial [Terrimicrobiaceae bacterium]